MDSDEHFGSGIGASFGSHQSPLPLFALPLWHKCFPLGSGRFRRPSGRAPFSDEGGFTFSEAPFEGTLHEGLKGASPSEGFKGASPSEGGGLEGGLKGASRGLQGGFKGA